MLCHVTLSDFENPGLTILINCYYLLLLGRHEFFKVMEFEIFAVVNIKLKVFWDVAPCNLVDRH
jgi:hypothetical protein